MICLSDEEGVLSSRVVGSGGWVPFKIVNEVPGEKFSVSLIWEMYF